MPGLVRGTLGRVDDALHEVELLRVRLPLLAPFRTARSTTAVKEALLLRVRTTAGEGWGECTAAATPAYDGETIDGARIALRDHLLPRAFAGATLADVRGNPSARAALECALLDARLRADGVSLASWLGADRDLVQAGVAVGLIDDADELRRVLAALVAAGYRRIKCKIEPGRDVGVLRTAREPSARTLRSRPTRTAAIRSTGPGSSSPRSTTSRCSASSNPPRPRRSKTTRPWRARCALPSASTRRSPAPAPRTTRLPAARADVISVKVGRLGIADARRVHDECVRTSVGALPGGLLETGIGRAALLAVAALPGFTLTGDCSASERYFGADGDITEPFVLADGKLRVPAGPGLGVAPIPDRLEQCTIARERLTVRG